MSSLSNVSPPTELPTFILEQQSAAMPPKDHNKKKKTQKIMSSSKPSSSESSKQSSPAKVNPVEKSTEATPTPKKTDVLKKTDSTDNIKELKNEEDDDDFPSMSDIANALSPLTEKSSVLFGWMKDTVKTGVQKAKNSVDTLVTTLDPQMKDIIYSGGETEIIVSSANDDKIRSIREAFQDVFGRATVVGFPTQSKTVAVQPVGYDAAEKASMERITNLRSNEAFKDKVIVGVENFIVEIYKNQWFDVGILLLTDPKHDIILKSFTQMTSIPYEIIKFLQDATPAQYERKDTGYAITIGEAMGKYLNTPHYEWHKTYTTIDRCEMIVSAGLALASIYKYDLKSKIALMGIEEKSSS